MTGENARGLTADVSRRSCGRPAPRLLGLARGYSIFTPRGADRIGQARMDVLGKEWERIVAAIEDRPLRLPATTGELAEEYKRFASEVVQEQIRNERAVLALTTVATILAAASTAALLAYTISGHHPEATLSYLVTGLTFGLVAGRALKSGAASVVVLAWLAALVLVASCWWLSGFTWDVHAYPQITAAGATARRAAAVGVALGAALVALLIFVALVFAALAAVVRRARRTRQAHNFTAFATLQRVIVGLLSDEGRLQRPKNRQQMVADMDAAGDAVRRKFRPRRRHDVQLNRNFAAAVDYFDRHRRSAQWAAPESDDRILTDCLQFMIAICLEYYGVLPVGPPDPPPRRPVAPFIRRVVGGLLPLAAIGIGFWIGVPLATTTGSLFAVSCLLLALVSLSFLVDPNFGRIISTARQLLHHIHRGVETEKKDTDAH